jgi:hypothetical protein
MDVSVEPPTGRTIGRTNRDQTVTYCAVAKMASKGALEGMTNPCAHANRSHPPDDQIPDGTGIYLSVMETAPAGTHRHSPEPAATTENADSPRTRRIRRFNRPAHRARSDLALLTGKSNRSTSTCRRRRRNPALCPVPEGVGGHRCPNTGQLDGELPRREQWPPCQTRTASAEKLPGSTDPHPVGAPRRSGPLDNAPESRTTA